jgi:hypothetical protein
MPQDDPRTVLHGIDQSCPAIEDLPGRDGSFLTTNDKGNMASECYVEEYKSKHVFDADVSPLPDGTTSRNIKWLPMEYVAFEYQFEEHGGAVGVHNLRTTVPEGTIMIGGVINTVEAFTSGGAPTFELWVEAAGDILASAGYANVQAEGLHAVVPVFSAATGILTTDDRQIKCRIGTAAITAGRFYGYLTCYRSLTPAQADAQQAFWEEKSSSSLSTSSTSTSSVSASSASASSGSSSSASTSSPSSSISTSSRSTSSQSASSGSTSSQSASSGSTSSSSASSSSASTSSTSSISGSSSSLEFS